jgi:hypothetical protein
MGRSKSKERRGTLHERNDSPICKKYEKERQIFRREGMEGTYLHPDIKCVDMKPRSNSILFHSL